MKQSLFPSFADFMMVEAQQWTTDDVARWLQQNGFGKYSDLFCKEHDIDGQVLLLLTENDLREPPLSLSVLGDIKRLVIKISQLRRNSDVDGSLDFLLSQNQRQRRDSKGSSASIQHDFLGSRGSQQVSVNGNSKLPSRYRKTHFMEEKRKTFISFIYVFVVFLVTAFVMVVVHDRVPDMER